MKVEFFKNAAWSAGATAVKAFFSFLNALLTIRLLGVEVYGQLLTLLAFFTLYVGFSKNMYTVLVARLMGPEMETQPSMRSALLSAAVLLSVGSLSFLAVITIGTYWWAPGVFALNEFLTSEEARKAAMLLGGVTAIQVLAALQSAIIESSGRLDLAMKSQLLGPLALSTILALKIIMQTAVSPVSYLEMLFFSFGLDLIVLSWIRYRVLRLKTIFTGTGVTIRGVKILLVSGGVLQAASLMNLFLEPLNKILLNHFIGPVVVTVYELAMKTILGIQMLFSAAMRSFLHIAYQDSKSVGRIYLGVIELIAVPVLIIHAIGAIMLFYIVRGWVDIHSSQLFVFYSIATVSNILMIMATPFYIALIGRNDLIFIFRMHFILALINLATSLLLIPNIGLVGSAVGLCIACLYNLNSVCRRHVLIFNYRLLDWSKMFVNNKLRLILHLSLFVIVIMVLIGGFGSFLLFAPLSIALLVAFANEPLSRMVIRHLIDGLKKFSE